MYTWHSISLRSSLNKVFADYQRLQFAAVIVSIDYESRKHEWIITHFFNLLMPLYGLFHFHRKKDTTIYYQQTDTLDNRNSKLTRNTYFPETSSCRLCEYDQRCLLLSIDGGTGLHKLHMERTRSWIGPQELAMSGESMCIKLSSTHQDEDNKTVTANS